MADLGFPSEVIEGIKDGIDCNLYFFGDKVELGTMYIILGGAVVALVGVYVLLNVLCKKNK
ncbi:MAG: ABC transporter, partial [Lachnospiraceae bacterium]